MAVNLSPVFGAGAQLFNNDGVPLAGGLIYTYAAGTSTPQAVYTSGSGLIQHSNPIVLDASGRVPGGEIWLSDGVSYKFVVETSAFVLIGSYDNLVGINSNFVSFTSQEETQTATQGQTVFTLATLQYQPGTNNLLVFVNGSKQIIGQNYTETSATVVTFASGLNVGDVVDFTTAIPIAANATTSSNVSYNEGDSGAVTRTVTSKLQENISVQDFGADKTGSANATTAFTNAGSAKSDLEVNIPLGTYKLTTSPTVSGNATWIFEKGATTTGAGVLPGNILSRSNTYTPAWVTNSYNNAWGYMPPNSIQTNFVKSGGLAFTAMAQSTLSTGATIGFSSAMENISSGTGSTWNFYGTSLANSTAIGASTVNVELDLSCASTNVGTAVALAINAGGEAANQAGKGYVFKSASAAIQIAQNNGAGYSNVNFTTGIYITNNAIEPVFNTAINLSQNHAIRWTGTGFSQLSSIGSYVTSSSLAQFLSFNDSGLVISNASNYPLLKLNNNVPTANTNYFLFSAAATGATPVINTLGVDTNIDLKLFPKGTGCVDFASTGVTGSAGSLFGYLPIKVNGTIYKIPLYNV
jgi:hypothetical protein